MNDTIEKNPAEQQGSNLSVGDRPKLVKPTQEDVKKYIAMINKAKAKFGGSDTTEENHKLLNDMEWGAIIRGHAND